MEKTGLHRQMKPASDELSIQLCHRKAPLNQRGQNIHDTKQKHCHEHMSDIDMRRKESRDPRKHKHKHEQDMAKLGETQPRTRDVKAQMSMIGSERPVGETTGTVNADEGKVHVSSSVHANATHKKNQRTHGGTMDPHQHEHIKTT